ncbi:Orotidine 5'-phosphate decarboxylase [Rubrobacter xylanophilus DSM 9941]|uniref:orotidine-5'-phosphate decarboxylase n=1 Tax=Rubrobacter xylanophilus TaxID=49319 RepID=UPI002279AE1D|nr:orotidine-5'-phosphate decarboxylase [Rubrobacter xylanophilus]QYJ17311.1 Orotidine 5'-phosphate decarboxylase [Rubrobacter xylanophilus DSM 9941]
MQALVEVARRKGSALVVGLDPVPDRLPSGLLEGREEHEAVFEFCRDVLEAVAPYAAAVKIQLACFERLGPEGMRVYGELVREASGMGLPVIADAKRGDIAETAAAYAEAHLRRYGAHCITVNPYMGADAVLPFLEEARRLGHGGGVFVLVATSNPSAGAFQEASEPPASELAARLVAELGEERGGGYPDAGAVVGVTRPEAGRRVRGLLPRALFLAPGFGAQGGGVAGVRALLDGSGGGVLVASSRAILYAFEGSGGDYRDAAAEAARTARNRLRAAGVRV